MEKKLRPTSEIDAKLDELTKKYAQEMPTLQDMINLAKQDISSDKIQEQLFLQNNKMNGRWFIDAQRFALQQILEIHPDNMQKETESRMQFLDKEIKMMDQDECKRMSEIKNQPFEINITMEYMKKSQTLISYQGQLEMIQWALNG